MSIREIAKRAKVSIGTVDRVINNRGRVAKETKEKVLKIIKEINYQPNIYARNLSLSKEYRFSILIPELSQDCNYWKLHKAGIDKALTELVPNKVKGKIYYFSRYSEASLQNAFYKMLNENPDGVIIAPVLEMKTRELLENFSKNKPYVFIDSDIPGQGNCASVIQDSYESGVLAAKLMNMIISNRGEVAIVKVMPDDFHIIERIKGFMDFMKDKNIKITLFEVNSNNPAEFETITKKIVKEIKNIKGVFVSNVWVHAVAKNIKKICYPEKIFVIGYDLVEENLLQIERDSIDFIISQRPELQGYDAVFALYKKVVLRERIKKKIKTPIDIITKENMAYYSEKF